MSKHLFLIFFLLFLFSCNHRNEPVSLYLSAPEVVEARGKVVPVDSLAGPEVIIAGKPDIIKAGTPKIIPAYTNVHHPGYRLVIKTGAPGICTPGHNNFSLPVTIPAIMHPVAAGIPEVVVVQKAHIMENSPQDFSSFGKLQGLKTNTVFCIAQDNFGNLWFGTSGGVARYDGNFFTHYTSKEGLCHNFVKSILFDKNNNLWLGTEGGGVSKFDGKFFTNFTMKEGLPDNTVLKILEDKKGNIWFGTEGGVAKYDGRSFTRFTREQGLVSNVVFSICEDDKGDLWFGTAGGVSMYDGNSFSNFTVKEGLNNDLVICIIQDRTGNYWFGTKNGALKYDGKFFTHFTMKEDLSNTVVNSILEDRNGDIWFGTWGDGVLKYDGNVFTHFTEEEGLINNNEINAVFQDKEGILWFGTRAGGAGRYGGSSFEHFTAERGLSYNQVQSIALDAKGNIWIGTWGMGASRYDGRSFIQYTEKEGLINNDVRSITEDRKGNLWFATWRGVSRFDGSSFTQLTEKEGLCDDFVISALEDAEGSLWFGTEGGGVSKYDGTRFMNFSTKEGLSGNSVRSIIQDKKGAIWFGTNRGLTKYDPPGKQGKGYGAFTLYTQSEGLPDDNVTSLLTDQRGNIWIGSLGGGLTKYDGKYFTNFTEHDGLCENGVTSVLEDRKGNLWIGTRRGFSKFAKETIGLAAYDHSKKADRRAGLFKNYKYDDGFFGVGCNTNSICEDTAGVIWIGANDRLTSFRPAAVFPDTVPPNAQLTGIALFDEPVNWSILEMDKGKTIILSNGVILDHIKFNGLSKWYNIPENLSLPYNNNFLRFNFIGITSKSAQNVSYSYKLDGLDENWNTQTKQTSASYGNLSHGQYIFRVKAMNDEGFWSDEFTYGFTIRPPWWKTKWAFLFYAVVFIAGLFLVDRIQTQRVVAKERERIKEHELEQAREIEKAYRELSVQKEIVDRQKNEVERQKKRSDELLLNILPSEIAEELKEKGFAEAQHFDEVTVLFTDFKGFTNFSEMVSPKELVAEIHECFSAFDLILQKHGVEKIKTIGDSYMAAGGLPVPNKTHAIDVVNTALDLQQFMYEHKRKKENAGEPFLEIRIGIHTGPVVAGIVGVKKFAYDIWGDTVNTASHMERSGEVGRVNISETTFQLVKDLCNWEYRGKVEAKNKGMIDMYFVNC